MNATIREHHELDARAWAMVARVAAGALFAGFVMGIGSTAAVAPTTAASAPPKDAGGAWTPEHGAIPAANDEEYETGENGLRHPTF